MATRHRTRKSKRKPYLSRRKADQIWREFLRQPAQITPEQRDAMERNFLDQAGPMSFWRRCALASLVLSGRELEQSFGRKATVEDAKLAAEQAVNLDTVATFYEGVSETIKAAAMRLHLAMLERADYQELVTIAEASRGALPQTSPAPQPYLKLMVDNT